MTRSRPKESPKRTSRRQGGAASPARDPPDDSIAEAVERIVPRRQLRVENDDICITYARSALRGAAERRVYTLAQDGHGPIAGRFANFEDAVAAGNDVARQRQVRLFSCDPDAPPQLLRDYRPKSAPSSRRRSGAKSATRKSR